TVNGPGPEGRIHSEVKTMNRAHKLAIQLLVASFLSCVSVATSAQDLDLQTKTLTANNEEARAQALSGLEHDRTGRYSEAVAAYRRALDLAPTDGRLYNNLGNALANLRRYDEAIAALKRAIDLIPNFAVAHFNLAIVYTQTNCPGQ